MMRQMPMLSHAAACPRQAHSVYSLDMARTGRNASREDVARVDEMRTPRFTGNASNDLPGFHPWWEVEPE